MNKTKRIRCLGYELLIEMSLKIEFKLSKYLISKIVDLKLVLCLLLMTARVYNLISTHWFIKSNSYFF